MLALFSSLSLFFPVPIFWLPLRLRQEPGVCYVALPMVVRTLPVGPGVFPMLPDCPSPSIMLWVYCFQWLLFSTGVPNLRDGVTPAGSRFVCPRSYRRCSVPVWVWSTGQFLFGPQAFVCGVSACPVPPGVLPDGPPYVRELRLSLAPSSVLPCP